MIVLAVTFVVKKDHIEDFEQVIKTQATNSITREPECLQFDVCFDPTDRSRVFLYEVYTNHAALEVHRNTEYFLKYSATVEGWIVSKTAEQYQRWSGPVK
ncbi:MAG: putative quinol monooxygenase [Desulforhopalus sp.]